MLTRRSNVSAIRAASSISLFLLAAPTFAQSGVVPFPAQPDHRSAALLISADGRRVFGSEQPLDNSAMPSGVWWDLESGTPVRGGFSSPNAQLSFPWSVSADGRAAVGRTLGPPIEIFRWDAPDTATFLPSLPGWDAIVPGVATAGGDIVGLARSREDAVWRGALWPENGAPQTLPFPAGASGVLFTFTDSKGGVFLVARFGASERRMYRLDGATLELLFTLPANSDVLEVTKDGTAVLGVSFASPASTYWVWTQQHSFTTVFTGDPSFSTLTSANSDGSTVFGTVTEGPLSPAREVAWTRAGGVVPLEQYFVEMGVDLAGWRPTVIHDVSADDTRYVGFGIGPGDSRGGLMIVLDDACRADFNNDGAANSQDYFDFLGAFFAADQSADFNDDTLINSQDFFDFLGAFFTGCG